MKTGALIIALALAALGATPAYACLPEAPPHWESIFIENGPAVAIVRIVKMERAEEARVTEYFESWDYTATARVLDVIQATPKREYPVIAVGESRRLRDGPMYCADRMTLNVGEVHFGYERPDGSLRIYPSAYIPPEYSARVEAFK